MSMAKGHTDFQDRLKRIEKKGAGRNEVFNTGRWTAETGGRAKRACRLCFLKLPLSFLVGFLSFTGGQYTLFRAGGLPPEYALPDYELVAQAGMALVITFAVRLFLNLTGKSQFVMSVLGIAASITLMHNLVHIAPAQWSELFSPQWVDQIRKGTEPGTLLFRGETLYRLG